MKSFILGAMLALGATAASAQTTIIQEESTGAIRLSPDQRTVIRRSIVRERVAPRDADVEYRVGVEAPRGVEYQSFPDAVLSVIPGYRSYRYFQAGDRVVVVDRETNRVVEILD